VVHFEIIGTDPAKLRDYYGELFSGGSSNVGDASTEAVSTPETTGSCRAVRPVTEPASTAAWPVATAFQPRVLFYVGVPDVEARAAQGGEPRRHAQDGAGAGAGRRRDLVVAHFTDPEGNMIGLAGTA